MSSDLTEIEEWLAENDALKVSNEPISDFFNRVRPCVRSKLIRSNQFNFTDLCNFYATYDNEWLDNLFENYVFCLWRHTPTAYYIMQNPKNFYAENLIDYLENQKKNILLRGKTDIWLDNFPAKTNFLNEAHSEPNEKFVSITGEHNSLKDFDNFYKVIDKNKNNELREKVKKWLKDNRELLKPYLLVHDWQYRDSEEYAHYIRKSLLGEKSRKR